jgi:hypothetical protein
MWANTGLHFSKADVDSALVDREQKYRRALQEAQGGSLPMFKECRQQVYEYWNEKGIKASSVRPELARSSLEEWQTRCATSAQEEDADSFSRDIYEATRDNPRKFVEKVGDAFEQKWQGIFRGALSPEIEDKLTDATEWNGYTDALQSMGIADVAQTVLNDCDEIYKANLLEPLKQLLEVVDGLPEGRKGEAKEAIESIKEAMQSKVGDLMVTLRQRLADTRLRFDRDELKKMLDRGELKKLLID